MPFAPVLGAMVEGSANRHLGVTQSSASARQARAALAKEMRGNYCNKFNPIEPGDNFQSMLRDIDIEEEDEKPPLIVVMEEIDTIIETIHRGEVPSHKKVTTMIRNKSSYNTFFDDMIIHTKVIFILTSNKSKDEIDKLDPCYLRQGRINAYYTMMTPLAQS